jgi:hypothetical protein
MCVFVTGATGFSGSARSGQGLCQQAQSTMVGERPATTELAVTPVNLNQARYEALFVSELQPTDAPTADMVAEAIKRTVRQFGVSGCAGRMAQEFGDHPDEAVTRMRWVRRLAWTPAGPHASPDQPPGRSAERAVAPGGGDDLAAAAAGPRKTARWPSASQAICQRTPPSPAADTPDREAAG